MLVGVHRFRVHRSRLLRLEAKMTESKDGNQKTRIPYELPKLFDLGGGVAYAKGTGECKDGTGPAGLICKAGGSPGGGTECKLGRLGRS